MNPNYLRVVAHIRAADSDEDAANVLRSVVMWASSAVYQGLADQLQRRADVEDRDGADADQVVDGMADWLADVGELG